MHRYEQVDHPSNKAVTFTLGTNGGRDRGEVIGPSKIILRANKWSHPLLNRDRLHRQKPLQWLRSWRITRGLPLVVVDPDGIWNPVWGELYRSAGPRAGGVNEITPGIRCHAMVGRANSM